eukprot:7912000-Lingulodinium_polyedra.AAC.1
MRTAETVARVECAGEPLRQRTVDANASLCSVVKTPRGGAVESTVRRRAGSQIARVRTPCARQKT